MQCGREILREYSQRHWPTFGHMKCHSVYSLTLPEITDGLGKASWLASRTRLLMKIRDISDPRYPSAPLTNTVNIILQHRFAACHCASPIQGPGHVPGFSRILCSAMRATVYQSQEQLTVAWNCGTGLLLSKMKSRPSLPEESKSTIPSQIWTAPFNEWVDLPVYQHQLRHSQAPKKEGYHALLLVF